MIALPSTLVIGGRSARWVWGTDDPEANLEPRTGKIPCGILLDHGDHTLLLPWVALKGGNPLLDPFTLDSLLPLTLVELVICPMCRLTGRIVEGSWLPVDEVARG